MHIQREYLDNFYISLNGSVYADLSQSMNDHKIHQTSIH